MEIGEFEPTWSPDGQWIAYTTWSDTDGGHLYKVRADGRTKAQRLTRASALLRRARVGARWPPHRRHACSEP